MAAAASSILRVIRSFPLPRRRGSAADDYRLLVSGPHEIVQLLKETFSSKFPGQMMSVETLKIERFQGFSAGWSRLSVAMNDAFIVAFYTDDEDCFQKISAFREVIVAAKGENVPLLVLGYNRATSAPRIMGPETADCLVTIEWGLGYAEASVGRPADLERVCQQLFEIIRNKYIQKTELQRMVSL